MTDEQALRAAILAEPDDDTPRLAYADWLEENGQHDRAEFIRVQCELARMLDGWKPETWDCLDMYLDPQSREDQKWKHEVWRLREREQELLRHVWRSEGKRKPLSHFVCDGVSLDKAMMPRVTYRRGFVHAVTATAADFLRHAPALVWPATVECPVCEGKKGWVNPVGGFREFSGPYPVWKPCPSCSGTGRVPNPDPPAATCQPVRKVTLSDLCEPPSPRTVGFVIPVAALRANGGAPFEEFRLRRDGGAWRCDLWPGVRFHLPAVETAPA